MTLDTIYSFFFIKIINVFVAYLGCLQPFGKHNDTGFSETKGLFVSISLHLQQRVIVYRYKFSISC
jgi:hypothetical protein